MSHSYTCVILDDEPKAIELLEESINALYSNISIIAKHTSWKQALETLRNNDFDLLFIDISMPQKSGLDILDLVPGLTCEIIFVTAYTDYAVSAFGYGASGYLLKPVRDKELSYAVDKAIERTNYKRLLQKTPKHNNPDSKIAIPNSSGVDYIDIDDIVFLEATTRYTRIIMKKGEILCSYNLGKFKDLLEQHSFYQVHRSYIVNLKLVTGYKNTSTVLMTNGSELPVARNTKDNLLNKFLRLTRS